MGWIWAIGFLALVYVLQAWISKSKNKKQIKKLPPGPRGFPSFGKPPHVRGVPSCRSSPASPKAWRHHVPAPRPCAYHCRLISSSGRAVSQNARP
ncbi:hypothetical protein M0R45_005237 [Rubus argutus]|uniref:ATP synthase F0 subunit 8 n=1 Tax=Rubus argutus TaxID=59490 RepID=A0AAW1YMM7_RUBAR